MPREQAEELRDEIKLKASIAGVDFADHLDVFPKGGQGGLVRILGRNGDPKRRAQGVDVPLNVDGHFSMLEYLKPLRFKAREIHLPKPKISRWNIPILERGIGINATHDEVVKIVTDLARDAYRLSMYDRHEAWPLFVAWIDKVKALSPGLSENKLALLSAQHKECERLFGYGVTQREATWTPFTLIETFNDKSHAKCFMQSDFFRPQNLFLETLEDMGLNGGVIDNPTGLMPQLSITPEKVQVDRKLFSHGAGRLYRFLRDVLASTLGLNRLSLRINTERIADHLAVSQPRAWYIIKEAIKQGLLLEIEPGKNMRKARRAMAQRIV